MRNALPTLLILLAAAAGLWLLFGAADDEGSGAYDAGPAEEIGPPDLATATPFEADGLKTKGRVIKKKRAVYQPADPRTLPKGNLVITMLGPDLKPIEASALRVYVDPGKNSTWHTKQGLWEPEKKVWRFTDVVAGQVNVRVQGDHIVARTLQTVVKKERDNELSITLDLAGSIRYDVMKYDKKRPEKVQLTLFDWEDKPVEVWYQERTSRRLTTPVPRKTVEIGPEGVVFGILPGRYKLRVVSVFEEWDEAKVDIVAGKTAEVSLEVRR